MPDWEHRGYKYRPVRVITEVNAGRLIREGTFRHNVETPKGEHVVAPFFRFSMPDRDHFRDWVDCGCPPPKPFGWKWVEFDALPALLAVIQDCGFVGVTWSEIAKVLQMLDPPELRVSRTPLQEVAVVEHQGHRCWSLCRPRKRTTIRTWTHEVLLPNGEVREGPFRPGRPVGSATFRRWVEIGCPPAEPFNVRTFSTALIQRLGEVSAELAGEPGDWDTLAVMEVLTRRSAHEDA